MKIFIDPGHGGSDPGATGHGLKEKAVCLTLALALEEILMNHYTGHEIKLSRRQDETISLTERTHMANRWGAHYLVSIHINAGGGTGFESYIYNQTTAHSTRSKQFRTDMHQAIVKTTGLKDRGPKKANFHMLRESLMPAILTENGFIDMAHDAHLLKDMAFLYDIATAHAQGIARAFKLKRLPSGGGSRSGEASDQVVHSVVRGDTLWDLARRYETTVDKLKQWNPSVVPKRLQVGRRLIVGEGSSGAGMYHAIVKDDTLWRLSRTYGTTVHQLLNLNPDLDPNKLAIGSNIRIK